jgi:hypothetical protein
VSEKAKVQEVANRVNMGAHQKEVIATDETGAEHAFIVHRPTMKEEIRLGVLYSQLKGEGIDPVPIDDAHDNLAFMVATVNTVVDEGPATVPDDAGEWRDTDLLVSLFAGYTNWRDSFRRQLPVPEG